MDINHKQSMVSIRIQGLIYTSNLYFYTLLTCICNVFFNNRTLNLCFSNISNFLIIWNSLWSDVNINVHDQYNIFKVMNHLYQIYIKIKYSRQDYKHSKPFFKNVYKLYKNCLKWVSIFGRMCSRRNLKMKTCFNI